MTPTSSRTAPRVGFGTPTGLPAVFFSHRRQWHTVGKTIFNMNPAMAIEHFKNQYEPVKDSREGHV